MDEKNQDSAKAVSKLETEVMQTAASELGPESSDRKSDPEVVQREDGPTDKKPMREPRRMGESLILVACAGVFLSLVIFMPELRIGGFRRPVPSWFWAFATLPGLAGVANHLVTERHRAADSRDEIAARETALADWCKGKARPDQMNDPVLAALNMEAGHRPNHGEAAAAGIFLTGVFLVIGQMGTPNDSISEAIVYAGYGAYISTLWYMLVRLNANALSPRFLANSAIKASIGMLLALSVASSGVLAPLTTTTSAPALYFLIGLFHPFALKALRRMAIKAFGVTQPEAADMPLNILQGVDDGAVDVLEELGVTRVQHLATMHAAEVCGRSLYPRDRVLDWIDQAILAMHTDGRLDRLRSLGIHSAQFLIRVAELRHACERKGVQSSSVLTRWKEIARCLGLSDGGLELLVVCIKSDPAYKALNEAYPRPKGHRRPIEQGLQHRYQELQTEVDVTILTESVLTDGPQLPVR